MKAYLHFLRTHPAWWLLPIVLYAVGVVWLATQVVQTPENPFAYSVY